MISDSQKRSTPRGRSRAFVRTRVLTALVVLLSAAASAAPTVVVSIPPYADLVARLAGPEATVVTLLPGGASPHAFDPTPRDLARLEGADLVVLNGGLDEWVRDLVGALDRPVPVFEALQAIDPEVIAAPAVRAIGDGGAERDEAGQDDAADPDEDGLDPNESADHAEGEHEDDHAHEHEAAGGINAHVWLDPLLVATVVPDLAAALDDVDPDGAARRAEAAARLVSELEDLHVALTEILAPVAGQPFVPFHDAWPHFAARYGLDLVLEIEPFPGREPSARELARAVEAVRASGAHAIFNEAQLSDRPARVLADEAGVRVATLDPLGGTGELRTYEALLRHNATRVADMLGDD